MALGIDDFYFALLILGTLLALFILWYVKARSRHRRENNCLASPTVKKSFQTPFEMSTEKDRREGTRGSRGSGRGPGSGSRRAVGSSEASVGSAMMGRRETNGERKEKGRRGKANRRENDGFDGGATGGGRGGATSGAGGESIGGRQNWATQDIVVKVNQKTGEEFTFFWGPGTVFSQWYPARFVVNGITYKCAEQYMMHQKACELICVTLLFVIDVVYN